MRRGNKVQLKPDVVKNVAQVRLSKTLKTKMNTRNFKEKMHAESVNWANNRFSMLK